MSSETRRKPKNAELNIASRVLVVFGETGAEGSQTFNLELDSERLPGIGFGRVGF